MDRRDKQNLRDLLWLDRAAGAGQPAPDVPAGGDDDVFWARAVISELSADPAIWSSLAGADPDWALADLQDDAGFLDELMSGAALLDGDDCEDPPGLPALGADPALDDLFADLPGGADAPGGAPKPRRRPRPAQHPADPALDDILAQVGAETAPAPDHAPHASQRVPPKPAELLAGARLSDPVQSGLTGDRPRGLRVLRRVFIDAGRRRRVDG